MTKTINFENFKKWVIPVLIFIFCEFVFAKNISSMFLNKFFIVDIFNNSALNYHFFYWIMVFCYFLCNCVDYKICI